METSHPLRFGPSTTWWWMATLPVALTVAPAWLCARRGLPTAPDAGPVALLYACALLVGAAGCVLALATWAVYEVREDGLVQRRLGGRRVVPWTAISHLLGREFGEGPVTDDSGLHPRAGGSPDARDFILRGYDARGRVLFALGPWVARRRQLAREIRRRLRATR